MLSSPALRLTPVTSFARGLSPFPVVDRITPPRGSLLIPSIWGSKVYVGMSATAFRNGVLWILVFAGLTMLASAGRNLFF